MAKTTCPLRRSYGAGEGRAAAASDLPAHPRILPGQLRLLLLSQAQLCWRGVPVLRQPRR